MASKWQKPPRRIPRAKMRLVAATLSGAELAAGADASFDADSLFAHDGHPRESGLAFGLYSPEGLYSALERYGVFDVVRAAGYKEPRTSIDTTDSFAPRFTVTDGKDLLADLVLTTRHKKLPGVPADADVLFVEWMMLANPRAGFGSGRQRLPGQVHPGLGIAREILELVCIMAGRLGLAAVVARPEYFHVASTFRRLFRCAQGAWEGWLAALARDLSSLSMCEASWGVRLGCVRERGRVVAWPAPVMVRYLKPSLGLLPHSPPYLLARAKAKARHHFEVDLAALKAGMEAQRAQM